MSVVDTTTPATMTAIRCHGIQDYRTETVPTLPAEGLQPGELLVRVTRCGLCAGDSKCYFGAPMFWGDKSRKPYVETPVTPGHEFVGVVAAMGEGAAAKHDVEIGDAVTAEQVVACGNCLYCEKGMRWLCAPHHIFGFHTCVHGGLAEYMVFPAHCIVHKIPKSIPPEESVYVEPLSCAVHGVELADIGHDDCVVVSGCGPIGLGMVAAAKMRSPQRVVAIDCLDYRLDVARECGADIVLNPTKTDVVSQIQKISGGYGCDVYLEAAGNPASVVQGLNACRKAATYVSFSVFSKETAVDWTIIGDTKELNIRGGHCSGDTGYSAAIDMLAKGSIPVRSIVKSPLALTETVMGLEMVSKPRDSMKVTIDPSLGTQ